MKYVLILGDGMADEPLEELGGRTPLAYAHPAMDRLAAVSEIGMVKTVPEGMNPGSDTANLVGSRLRPESILFRTFSLEALNIGVDMKDGDVAIAPTLSRFPRKKL